MQPSESESSSESSGSRPTNEQIAHSIYPEPQIGFDAAGWPSQASVIAEQTKRSKKKRQFVLLVCLSVAALTGIVGWLFWSAQQDHSVYASLASEQYSQDGIRFGFMYPKVLKPVASPAGQSASIKAAFLGESGPNKVLIDGGISPIGQILQELQISPATLLEQMKTHTGSFVDKLRSANASVYNAVYSHCNSYLVTGGGQKDVLCVSSADGYTNVLVIGADKGNQYTLQLYMSTGLWTSHPAVWRKVEKSFHFG